MWSLRSSPLHRPLSLGLADGLGSGGLGEPDGLGVGLSVGGEDSVGVGAGDAVGVELGDPVGVGLGDSVAGKVVVPAVPDGFGVGVGPVGAGESEPDAEGDADAAGPRLPTRSAAAKDAGKGGFSTTSALMAVTKTSPAARKTRMDVLPEVGASSSVGMPSARPRRAT